MQYSQNCPNGSTFTWSTTSGTILSGQNTDSVQIVWNSPGTDTIVTIYNSTVCGLDTNYLPVTIVPYPTNQISGPLTGCHSDVDTFSTSPIPALVTNQVTKLWNVTGGGLNLNSSSANEIHYRHGLGPVETIVLTTDDHGCISTDTHTVNILPAPPVNLGPDPVICFGDSILLDAGPGYSSYAWSTGASLSAIFANSAIPYTISVTAPGYNCMNYDTVTPTIDPNCVWPGDANHDYIVDANDFLDIGIAFGDTGSLRPNANPFWSGQPCPDWTNYFLSGQNHKHADSDGNGLVDFPDTMSVSLYQGFTHLRVGESKGGVPLRIYPRIPLFAGQDSVELIVELGDPGFPVDSAYGLAFQLDYSTSDVYNGFGGKASSSFLGSPGNSFMAMGQSNPSGAPFHFAMVRTDHLPAAGFGEVCRIKLKPRPSVWTAHTKVQLPIALSHCRLIRPDGSEIPVTPMADTVWLYDLGYVSAPNSENPFEWSISPIPADDQLHLRLDGNICGPYTLTLTDLSGRVIATQSGQLKGCGAVQELELDVKAFECGVYALKVSTARNSATKRVVVLR
jgi:hypothetical protein